MWRATRFFIVEANIPTQTPLHWQSINIHNITEHRLTENGLLKLAVKDHDKDRRTKGTKTGKTKISFSDTFK